MEDILSQPLEELIVKRFSKKEDTSDETTRKQKDHSVVDDILSKPLGELISKEEPEVKGQQIKEPIEKPEVKKPETKEQIIQGPRLSELDVDKYPVFIAGAGEKFIASKKPELASKKMEKLVAELATAASLYDYAEYLRSLGYDEEKVKELASGFKTEAIEPDPWFDPVDAALVAFTSGGYLAAKGAKAAGKELSSRLLSALKSGSKAAVGSVISEFPTGLIADKLASEHHPTLAFLTSIGIGLASGLLSPKKILKLGLKEEVRKAVEEFPDETKKLISKDDLGIIIGEDAEVYLSKLPRKREPGEVISGIPKRQEATIVPLPGQKEVSKHIVPEAEKIKQAALKTPLPSKEPLDSGKSVLENINKIRKAAGLPTYKLPETPSSTIEKLATKGRNTEEIVDDILMKDNSIKITDPNATRIKINKIYEGGRAKEIIKTKTGIWLNVVNKNGKNILKPITEKDIEKLTRSDPSVTTDFLGASTLYNFIAKNLTKPFKAYKKPPIELSGDYIRKYGKSGMHVIVKQSTRKVRDPVTKRTIELKRPAVTALMRDVVEDIEDPKYRTEAGALISEFWQNPDRLFERMGKGVRELFWRPFKRADKLISVERKRIEKWLGGLRRKLGIRSAKRVGIYGIAQQTGGMARLKAMGVKEIPKLTKREMKVYQEFRNAFEDFHKRLSYARVLSGEPPLPEVENYFTFVIDMARMEKAGLNVLTAKQNDILRYILPSTTGFRFAKTRDLRKLYPLELDAFEIFRKYYPSALRHIHYSPVIAMGKELLGKLPSGKNPGEFFRLQDKAPWAHKYLSEYLTAMAGVKPKWMMSNTVADRALTKLNKNIPGALLVLNLRTFLLQPTAVVGAIGYLGPKYMTEGIAGLMQEGAFRIMKKRMKALGGAKGASELADTLDPRSMDANVTALLEAIGQGKFANIKRQATKIGMLFTTVLDKITATAVWHAAFKKARNFYGITDLQEAAEFADDVVTRTQASGALADLPKIMRYTPGKSLMLLQTFVNNHWNMMWHDIAGFKSPAAKGISKKIVSSKRVLDFLIAATLTNILYEDYLDMNSPYPTPIRAFQEAREEGAEIPSALWKAALENLELVPGIGSSMKYGSGMLGVYSSLGENIIDFTRDPSLLGAGELVGTLRGIPGTMPVFRYYERYEQGQPLWSRLGGKRVEPLDTNISGGIGGIEGLGGLEGIEK